MRANFQSALGGIKDLRGERDNRNEGLQVRRRHRPAGEMQTMGRERGNQGL